MRSRLRRLQLARRIEVAKADAGLDRSDRVAKIVSQNPEEEIARVEQPRTALELLAPTVPRGIEADAQPQELGRKPAGRDVASVDGRVHRRRIEHQHQRERRARFVEGARGVGAERRIDVDDRAADVGLAADGDRLAERSRAAHDVGQRLERIEQRGEGVVACGDHDRDGRERTLVEITTLLEHRRPSPSETVRVFSSFNNPGAAGECRRRDGRDSCAVTPRRRSGRARTTSRRR
jgi:hypothetical protein